MEKLGVVAAPTDERRCTGRNRAGERCQKYALPGVSVCRFHGGILPSVAQKSRVSREIALMEKRGIAPIDADDPEGRGDTALSVELRRTIAWIRFCEAQIEASAGVKPLRGEPEPGDALADVLGGLYTTAVESTSGTERGEDTHLVTEKQVRGVNVWEEKLRWNRTHLASLTRQWISAGFEQKRLELASRTTDLLVQAIDGIVRDLGHNPGDVEVRAIVKRRLSAVLGQAD